MMAHTIGKTLEVLLEVSFCTLAPSPDGHGVIFVRVARGGEFVKMGSCFVMSNNKETDTVRTTTVFLCVHLCLYYSDQSKSVPDDIRRMK